MDIREHVYKMIEDRGLIEYPEDEKFSELLKDVDSKLLLEDIDYFYNMWLKYQELIEQNFIKEWLHLKHVQESSFEIACFALMLKGDSSVTHQLLKYIPHDQYEEGIREVTMEDYNVQNLTRCIAGEEWYAFSEETIEKVVKIVQQTGRYQEQHRVWPITQSRAFEKRGYKVKNTCILIIDKEVHQKEGRELLHRNNQKKPVSECPRKSLAQSLVDAHRGFHKMGYDTKETAEALLKGIGRLKEDNPGFFDKK